MNAKVLQDSESAARWLDGQLPAMQEALATMVEVNSFTDNVEGGRRIGGMLREVFGVAGLTHEVKASARYADHLVFHSKGDAKRSPLAMIGHLDTVFPPGTFEGYKRDGDLARGPGVLDMKGGLCVVAWAIKAVAATIGLDAIAPLRIPIVADEEVGSPEGQAIIRDAIAGAKGALVFEAGRKADLIITRRKGTGGMRIVAKGKAAHAGANHKDGANALWTLAKFTDRVQSLTDYDRGVTVNVGKITGGQGKNTVPDEAEALLDIRFCTKADAEKLVADVHAIAEEAAAAVPGTSVVVEGGIARMPMERNDASVALMNGYAACARLSSLGGDEAALIGGGSDASTSSSMGIASIDGLGPRGIGFHTKDEQIEFATLLLKAQALARFLVQFGI